MSTPEAVGTMMARAEHIYIAMRKSDGSIRAMCCDDAGEESDTAEKVADWIKRGLVVERLSDADYRARSTNPSPVASPIACVEEVVERIAQDGYLAFALSAPGGGFWENWADLPEASQEAWRCVARAVRLSTPSPAVTEEELANEARELATRILTKENTALVKANAEYLIERFASEIPKVILAHLAGRKESLPAAGVTPKPPPVSSMSVEKVDD